MQDDGDGVTYLKIEPLHAPSVVYETGNSEPTRASTPCPRQLALRLRACVTVFLPLILTTSAAAAP